MWCKQCQQDVPGLVSSDDGVFCCPRCSGPLRAASAGSSGVAAGSSQSAEAQGAAAAGLEAGAFTPRYDNWETDEQLRHIHRVLGAGKRRDGSRKKGVRTVFPVDEGSELSGRLENSSDPFFAPSARLDPPHADTPGWHADRSEARRSGTASAADRGAALPIFTWTALSLGTMALVCGGILLGWSLCTGRHELWSIGTPVALCGQVALAVGLVLQLDRIWHNSRQAAAKLTRVDEELHELKTATTLLGTSHASPGGAFYAHMAGGAGPEILLSDLKGQLDLLAVKISKCE